MKLTQLQYFVTVCKHVNITAAAEELHISQPSVSAAIRELEKEFGVQLFYRNNRSISLTAEGKFFLSRATDILESTVLLEQQMCDLGSNKNNIHIGIPPMIGSVLYPTLVQDFNKAFPDIYTDIFEQGSVATIEMVLKDTLDAALVVTDDIIHQNSLTIVPVVDMPVHYCVRKDHPVACAKSIGLEEIQDQTIVMYKEGYYLRKALLSRYEEANIVPKIVLHTNQLYTIKNMVLNGIASAFLFQELAEGDPELVGIPLTDPLVVHIGLVWKTGNYIYSDVAKFLNFTKHYQFRP